MGKRIFCCKAVITEISGINVTVYKNINMGVTNFFFDSQHWTYPRFRYDYIFFITGKPYISSYIINCLVSYSIYMYSVPVYTMYTDLLKNLISKIFAWKIFCYHYREVLNCVSHQACNLRGKLVRTVWNVSSD